MALSVSVVVLPSRMLSLYRYFLVGVLCIVLFSVHSLLYRDLGTYGWFVDVMGLWFIAFLGQHMGFDNHAFELRVDSDGVVYFDFAQSQLSGVECWTLDEEAPILVWSLFVIMHVRDELGGKRRLLICRDAVCEDGFRQLRVVLLGMAHRRRSLINNKNDISEGNF